MAHPPPVAGSGTTSAAIGALLNRARTGLLINALSPTNKSEQFDFWQAYAMALRDMQTGGRGDKLAAKDAALHGYELPSFLQTAAQCLGNDVYVLPRAAVVDRLTKAGIKFPADDLANLQVVPAHQLENAVVAPADLHGKHAPAGVDGDDSALHGALPDVVDPATVRAFEAWENAYRKEPDNFLTPEECSRMEVAPLAERSAIYFMALLREVAAGSGSTKPQQFTSAPFCRDCKFFDRAELVLCLHPDSPRDLVYGIPTAARWMRQDKNRTDGICGPQGRLYEAETSASTRAHGIDSLDEAVQRCAPAGGSEITGAGSQHGRHQRGIAAGVASAKNIVD